MCEIKAFQVEGTVSASVGKFTGFSRLCIESQKRIQPFHRQLPNDQHPQGKGIKRFLRLILCFQRIHNLVKYTYQKTGMMVEIKTKYFKSEVCSHYL